MCAKGVFVSPLVVCARGRGFARIQGAKKRAPNLSSLDRTPLLARMAAFPSSLAQLFLWQKKEI